MKRAIRKPSAASAEVVCQLTPLQGLAEASSESGDGWVCRNDDPQFKVNFPRGGTLAQPGWLRLEYDFVCDEPTVHQLYPDFGQGYTPETVVTRNVEHSGSVQLIFHSQGGLAGVRLDPAMHQVRFAIRNVRLRWSQHLSAAAQESGDAGLDEYAFQPLKEVRGEAEGDFEWQSLGTDPCLRVVRAGRDVALKAGWYRCSVNVAYERERQLAKVYFDPGSGFSERDVVALVLSSGEPTERLVYLPQGSRALRFDPQERKGRFRIEKLSFIPMAARLAISECLERLLEAGEVSGSLSPDALQAELASSAAAQGISLAELLNRRYQESFAEPTRSLDYDNWIEEVEASFLPSPEEMAARLRALEKRPVISVIVPVYNPDEALLRACLDSVKRQSYPHWQLCIADDASPAPHVRTVLEAYRQQDSRIKVAFRGENGHISAASNSALALAEGDFVTLLDHDDLLAEHALAFVAVAVNEHPEASIIYSDEDKVDEAGQRFDPHFKSDWNPDLLYSHNYVSHLGVYRRDLLDRVGGFRQGVEGSQDYDLLLRCLPYVDHRQVVHIPRVLYHWRSVMGSTAMSSSQKDYTWAAGLKALKEYFARHQPEGVVVGKGPVANTYRVTWPVPAPAPLVSLLMPTRDRRDLLEVAVRSILERTAYQNYEILILDNGSELEETLAFFDRIQAEDPRVRVLRYDYPFNYSAINNFGVHHARGSTIGLINNDVEVIEGDWLDEMVGHVCRDDIGCVGAKLYYSNDTIQHAGVILGLGGVAGHSHKHFARDHSGYFHRLLLTQNLSAVTAACLLVRRSVYERVGGLDEENLRVAFNDVDFCMKVADAGLRNLWTPFAALYHHESVSRGKEDSPEKIQRFSREIEYMRERWGEVLDHDPFYSPNLTRDYEDFSISSR
ncbi:glycosyltransferase family 2 protein [Halomonas sp.]|uniref:glycosyltransferase family 2 protein n=1 Tax=Halomonas sp. TaxID=1486246 RepID=UPI0023551D11|nr:glycosyltransferase family 2 protein [Halomonas sp.]